jgi:hypothetical protein
MAELWEIEGFEFLKGTFHYENCRPYRLWYEYLRLSPIYYQAHKLKMSKNGLTKDEIKALPDDFDEVIETYNDFGDVYWRTFREWWAGTMGKAHLFGEAQHKLHATPLAYVPPSHLTNKQTCYDAIDDYAKYHSGYMLLAVPLNGSRADVVRAVSEQIDSDYLHTNKAKYALHGERFHYENVSTCLRLLIMKAREPKLALWRLGVKAGVSEKYAKLDIDVTRIPQHMVESTQTLENMTSRMHAHSLLIMENAARGRFPCKNKVVLPEINYRYMWQCVRRRLESNTRWAKRSIENVSKDPLKMYNEDWLDNLLATDPQFRMRVELLKLEAKKRFIEEQLALHKPMSYVIPKR